MMMWIQLHDLSNKEMEGATKEQAEQALSTFDWKGELSKEKESEDETCPPGLGLVSDEGEILHICPINSESCFIHYHYFTSKKLLGFIPITGQENHFIETCSITKATELIRYHFNGNAEEILKIK